MRSEDKNKIDTADEVKKKLIDPVTFGWLAWKLKDLVGKFEGPTSDREHLVRNAYYYDQLLEQVSECALEARRSLGNAVQQGPEEISEDRIWCQACKKHLTSANDLRGHLLVCLRAAM